MRPQLLLARKDRKLIAESDLLIFGRTAELPKKKTPGSLINIDGREYIVDYWSDNKGVSQITLRQNRTV